VAAAAFTHIGKTTCCATMPFMNLQAILIELREQRDRIQQAIDALERATHTTATGKIRGRKPGRHMSADARARIGAAMKKRWAARKKAQKKAS
jgi:hypothetical protein